mmetsp:Transcript_2355/g.4909  ORF Transcript_2355/g.4909 Transcript_2355/m.4909 type:complete len:92 (-) Transcript_2355:105-380(-)
MPHSKDPTPAQEASATKNAASASKDEVHRHHGGCLEGIAHAAHHAVEVAANAVKKHEERLHDTALHHQAENAIAGERQSAEQARFGTVAGV